MIKEQNVIENKSPDIQGGKLKKTFRKNGIDYRLLDRTNKTALFEQKLPTGEMAGYEVCKININKAGDRFGKYFPESESIPGNEQFGFDGSKAFFPRDLIRAKEYLKKLDGLCTDRDLRHDLCSAVS